MLLVKKVNTTALMLAPRVIQKVLDVPMLAVDVTLKLGLTSDPGEFHSPKEPPSLGQACEFGFTLVK